MTLREGVADKDDVINDLRELAATELPEHMQPEDINILDAMPLTPSGKIDYRKLEEWYEKNSASALLLE